MDKLPTNGSKNPVIGAIRCPTCDGVATVHEAQRRGKHLYTICPSCGTDQRTGKAVQAWIKSSMVDDVSKLPSRPKQTELPTEQTEPQTELPTKQTEPQTELPTKQTEPVRPNPNLKVIGGFAALVLLLLGAVVAFWKTREKSPGMQS